MSVFTNGRWTLVLALVLLTACRTDHDSAPPTSATVSLLTGVQEWFSERSAQAGLNFVHVNGMSGEFYYPEIMAPGVGLLDYDNDGDLDVYLAQGSMLGTSQAIVPPTGFLPLGCVFGRGRACSQNGQLWFHVKCCMQWRSW